MAKFIKKLSKQAGLVPGTLVHIGEKKTESVKITVFDYNAERFQEKVADKVEDIFPFKDTHTVTWINVNGLHDISIIENIGKHFELHPLVQEDIVNTGQRPKLEDFEKYIFVSLKMLYYDKKQEGIIIEQVSLVIGSNFVISFQEQEGDVFNPIRERIRLAWNGHNIYCCCLYGIGKPRV
ncbi:CorA family divalent cation transporter [Candidatus Omnitrophota bacterium]